MGVLQKSQEDPVFVEELRNITPSADWALGNKIIIRLGRSSLPSVAAINAQHLNESIFTCL